MAELFSVAGKTILVTGGSRGIGEMIARGMLDAGARVLICSRKPGAAAAVAAELSKTGECHALQADLTSGEDIAKLAEAVGEHFGGKLDVLVNNAGTTWGAPLEEFPAKGWEKVLSTNVTGVFELTKALLPALRAAGDKPARVINIGSVDGLRVPPFENYSYSASKAAVHMLTRHLAKRLAGEAITVNAIAPGFFPSDMTGFLLAEPGGQQAIEGTVPLGRLGGQDDIAGTAIFLSSAAGAYLTGAVLPVDGGLFGCG
ncbi:SDR family oxidoreductase [Amycolatopsis acidiphila]|uniref:SDR family oxidoreductase n=1 Tax=Amycolatopsis acidiphila TaxID=715473 RepID=A0A558A3U4_9PSEU|nr:SDR family NAD(P)-dependent oxidoreductase [Amycolatopsis acidiphila]TVT18917.1 SDR family oxidoreductase [Amycolatopsis acidiphila]UIJ60617.1 SDR family oxidoreductase [Amycolatopsis acidiphila]GHG81749.1 rhamnolipids biosynthesis 3-oxoacyl-[acyl-carrier-protein] reductase [Amycolatopsis acidiphila]